MSTITIGGVVTIVGLAMTVTIVLLHIYGPVATLLPRPTSNRDDAGRPEPRVGAS